MSEHLILKHELKINLKIDHPSIIIQLFKVRWQQVQEGNPDIIFSRETITHMQFFQQIFGSSEGSPRKPANREVEKAFPSDSQIISIQLGETAALPDDGPL